MLFSNQPMGVTPLHGLRNMFFEFYVRDLITHTDGYARRAETNARHQQARQCSSPLSRTFMRLSVRGVTVEKRLTNSFRRGASNLPVSSTV
jgi:hypothetical protein